jgi:hypothetical protein
VKSARHASEPRRVAIAIAIAIAIMGPGLLHAAPAFAQANAPAEALFEEGKALLQQKRYPEACAKLKASHDLDREAVGTLLNLALCHEATQKYATAWVEFREVAAKSANKREDRVAVAREHEAKLLSLLSYITIVVEPGARAAGLTVELDGAPIDEAAWGTALPMDPGAHVVRSSAPGLRTRTQEVVLAADKAERRTFSIAALDPAPPGEAPPARTASSGHRTLGFVLGAAGLASAATGVVFGIVAVNKNSRVRSLCPSDVCPGTDEKSAAEGELRAAKTDAIVSDLTIGVGALALVAGAYLVLTSRTTARPPANALRVVPVAGAQSATVQVSAAW